MFLIFVCTSDNCNGVQTLLEHNSKGQRIFSYKLQNTIISMRGGTLGGYTLVLGDM